MLDRLAFANFLLNARRIIKEKRCVYVFFCWLLCIWPGFDNYAISNYRTTIWTTRTCLGTKKKPLGSILGTFFEIAYNKVAFKILYT